MYNASVMIVSKFDDLRRHKAYMEKRDISLRKVAEETGLALGTIQRVNKGEVAKVNLSTLETLCRYFDVASLSELVEYRKNDPCNPSENP
jgi:DNA-binding Xre family transcriptional regulator